VRPAGRWQQNYTPRSVPIAAVVAIREGDDEYGRIATLWSKTTKRTALAPSTLRRVWQPCEDMDQTWYSFCRLSRPLAALANLREQRAYRLAEIRPILTIEARNEPVVLTWNGHRMGQLFAPGHGNCTDERHIVLRLGGGRINRDWNLLVSDYDRAALNQVGDEL